MPSNRTSIEIEAKGEFSQLTRGLRDVKSALGEVTKVVNTGARSGGFFSDEQIKSLDIFSRRFSDAMGRMGRLIDEQGEAIASLYKRRRDASSADIASIDKEIKKHGEYLDALEREREEMERIYKLRRQEAGAFGSRSSRAPASSGTGRSSNPPEPTNPAMATAGAGLLGLGRSMRGIGGFIAGLAGVALSINQLRKWEQMAEQNIQSWQPIIQRIGVNRAQMTSMGQSRGYNAFQTSQAVDIYSQTAGRISSGDAGRLMDFSRGYGVDVNTVMGLAGQMAVRGYGSASAIDRAAGVAESSDMQDRIVEVLETSQGFLQSMDKNLKDNAGNSLLAYTARINQIGKENGATKLTGQSGAGLLEQLGNNIFNPSNVRWQTLGINILSRFGGDNTKGMNSFDLMKTWQQGFQNPLNMKVLGSYLDSATSGMNDRQAREYKTLTLQEAMGGGTTIEQAQQFGEMTNWLKAFDPSNPKMQSLLQKNGLQGQAQTDQKATQWKGTMDAQIQISNAAWMNEQLRTGEIVIPTKLALQDFSTDLLSQLNKALEDLDIGNILGKKLREILGDLSWWDVIGTVAAVAIGGRVLKRLAGKAWSALMGGGGGGGIADDVTSLGKRNLPTNVKRGAGEITRKSVSVKEAEAADIRRQLAQTTDPAERARLQGKLDGMYQEIEAEMKKPIRASSPETVPNVPKVAPRGAAQAVRVGGKLLKGVPIVGGAVDVGLNRLSGQSWGESITRGVFSTLGGIAGGALGSFAGPAGTIVGGVGGGMAGDALGRKVYKAFAGSPEEHAKKQADAIQSLSYKGIITLGNLSEQGVQQLSELSAKGLVDINGMKNLSVEQVQQLRDQGILEVTNLSREGAEALSELHTSGDATLGMFKEQAVKIIEDSSAAQKLDVNTLATEGQQRLADLQTNGEIQLGKLNNDGTQQLTVLNTEGAKQLAELQSQGLIKLGSMDRTTTENLDKVVKTHKDLKEDLNKTTATGWGNFFGNIKTAFSNLMRMLGFGDAKDDPKAAELMKTDYGDSWGKLSTNEVRMRVAKELSAQGKSYWMEDVEKLMAHENARWNPSLKNPTGINPNTGALDPNGEHATGLFQFLPSTWKGYMGADYGDDPSKWSPEVQTRALIKYIDARYKGDFSNIKNFDSPNGNGPNDYKGYADGTYVARDQVAQIHAGEELISRAKTAEVQRKTGKLPSQVLNEYMSMSDGQAAAAGPLSAQATATSSASTSGGVKRIVVDVNLNGAQALQGLPVDMIAQIARQVFADAAYQAMRPQVQF